MTQLRPAENQHLQKKETQYICLEETSINKLLSLLIKTQILNISVLSLHRTVKLKFAELISLLNIKNDKIVEYSD